MRRSRVSKRVPSSLALAGALLGVAACAPDLSETEGAAIEPSDPTPLPALTDEVVTDNGYCLFQNTVPYVLDVRWDNELVQAAVRALGPGYRSTIAYGEWRIVYGLEKEPSGDHLAEKAAAARNFIRVLCGENRDDLPTFQRKLQLLANSDPTYRAAHQLPEIPGVDEPVQVYARPGEMQDVDLDANLFAQITYPAYQRMMELMMSVHHYRQTQRPGPKDGYHYGYHDKLHHSNRVDHSVAPWTHCEMKFMFAQYLGPDSPMSGSECDMACAAEYVTRYDQYRASSCGPDDYATMYDFRGHKVLQPLWLDSNGFLWNSLRAGTVDNRTRRQAGDPAYYLHPFASRYAATRRALGAFLFYPESDHLKLIAASEPGGGPILYLTDQDANADHLADYVLFATKGCGDVGPSEDDPQTNCNMVNWATAATTGVTTRHAVAWHPTDYDTPDLGFVRTFSNLDVRMTRFNQALDRHSNWGPTGYYMTGMPVDVIEHGEVVMTRPNFMGSYSPFVASSYDLSASDAFAHASYPSTHPMEQGHTKWIYVIRFKASDYYDETAFRNARDIDFDRNYFNETSLSNDFYHERALDHFGWIPAGDVYANIYFVYGSRGEEPEPIVDLPPPPAPVSAPTQ